MPRRKTMRRIKECYRLIFEAGLSQVQAASVLKIGRSTVWDYLQKLEEHGLHWEDVRPISEEALEHRLYSYSREPGRPLPDFSHIHKELQSNKTVTLYLLWEEYRDEHPQGYGYGQFCIYYRRWRKKLKTYMRQVHVAGEKVFVDYSGRRPFVVDRHTGEVKYVELFVMVWGASHYFYAEAQENQSLQNWTMGHVRAFEYFGCVPCLTVPDNYKGAVDKAHRYDPDLNRTYSDLASHYGFGILPARPYRPKDKAKVEVGVQILQRWILARLRNRTFFSLEELNIAIRELLDEANRKPMKKLGKSRLELFEEMDKPNARPLPATRYVYHQWLPPATVNIDYHIEIEKHYYSVPYTYYGKKVDVRISESLVEIFYKADRIATHHRSFKKYAYSTVHEHMPPSHQKHVQWTPARLIDWAKKIGPQAGKVVEHIIYSKPHPEQGFRPALGIMRLAKSYTPDRLENALRFAREYNLYRVYQISEILKKGLDREKEDNQESGTVMNVVNVRGAQYYSSENTPNRKVSEHGST